MPDLRYPVARRRRGRFVTNTRRRAVPLAPLLVAALLVTAPSPASQAGTIVFSSDRGAGFDLYVVAPDGGGARRLVGGEGEDHDPVWSPDGSRVAFARVTDGGRRASLYLVGADGSGLHRLTNGAFQDRQPAWSPDGGRIAFVRSSPGQGTSRIHVLTLGGGRRRLTEPPPAALDAHPSWSPDGTRIVFSRSRPGRPSDLFLMDADGSGLRRLTSGEALDAAPAWSPDAERIAFERCCPDGSSEIYVKELASGAERSLTSSPGHESSPAWSPDGSRIAFVEAPAEGGGRDLSIMDAAGGASVRVTTHARADLSPSWGPAPGDEPETSPEPSSEPSPIVDEPAGVEDLAAARRGRISQRSRRIARGVRLIRRVHRGVPQRVFALRVNPRRRAIDAALAGGRLAGRRRTSRMVRANGALAGVNGDFSLPGGSPVHAFLADGDLKRTAAGAGVHFGVSRDQRRVFLGWSLPGVRLLETGSGDRLPVGRWNDGSPVVGEVAGFTGAGRGLMRPPTGSCAVRLKQAGGPAWTEDGSVRRPYRVAAAGCFVDRLKRGGGIVLAAPPGTPEAALLRSMRPGDGASLSWGFGWPRAFDALGGTPLLVEDGRVVARPCGSAFCARHPRTAVGVTRKGKVLLVVVDGRRPRWSRGMTLVELAREMRRLGAVAAVNLDGGGSSTLVVRRRIVNRPSDARGERPVSSALLVLRGKDRTEPQPEEPAPLRLARRDVLRDPASTGGLLDALSELATWRR